MSLQAILLLLFTNIIGGSAYIATSYALDGFLPEQIVFFRVLLAAILFLPMLIRDRHKIPAKKSVWVRLCAVAFLGYALPLTLGTVGQKLSSATNASLLIGVEPIAIVILSAFFLSDPLTPLKFVAIASGILGACLIVLQGIPFINVSVTPHFRGDILLLLHGICWSLYSIIGKPLLHIITPMVFTSCTTGLAVLPLALMLLPQLDHQSVAIFFENPRALLGLIYLGVSVSFIATIAWNKALQMVTPSQLANFIFLQPLVGVLAGVWLRGETFTIWSAFGGILIILGAYAAIKFNNNDVLNAKRET